jgi:Putative phage serine protease XkdF
VVWGEVYAPGFPDSQGDFMTAETVREMTWRFMRKSDMGKIDIAHGQQKSGSYVVESFIARDDDSTFIPGAWVIAVKVPDPAVWQMVNSGKLIGLPAMAPAPGHWRRCSPFTLLPWCGLRPPGPPTAFRLRRRRGHRLPRSHGPPERNLNPKRLTHREPPSSHAQRWPRPHHPAAPAVRKTGHNRTPIGCQSVASLAWSPNLHRPDDHVASSMG